MDSKWIVKIMKYILKKTFFAILSALTLLCCIFALNACNGDSSESNSDANTQTASVQTESFESADTQKSESDREYSKNY